MYVQLTLTYTISLYLCSLMHSHKYLLVLINHVQFPLVLYRE